MAIKILLLTCVICLLSCNNSDDIFDDCVDDFRTVRNINSNEDYPTDCVMYFELYESGDGQFFFLAGNHCIDMVAIPQDCNGEEICPDFMSKDCSTLLMNATLLKVVGFEE